MRWEDEVNLPVKSAVSFARYKALVNKASERKQRRDGYLEHHHCWPKSHGGPDESWNLVYLTAREHFLAHWLLWKALRTRFMANAFNNMAFVSGEVGNLNRRYRITSRAFESARLAASVNAKERWMSLEARQRQQRVALDMGLGLAPKTERQMEQARIRAAENNQDPVVQAKKSKTMSQLIWVNDGIKNRRVRPGEAAAMANEGWSLGRFLSADSKAAMTRGLPQNI